MIAECTSRRRLSRVTVGFPPVALFLTAGWTNKCLLGVYEAAEIEFSIGNLDLSAIPFRAVNSERWLRVTVTANMRFSDDSLTFRILCEGRETGSCRVSYMN